MAVRLRPVDADALLAATEAALNARLDFGPGLHRRNVEEAARRVESVADLQRRGVTEAALHGQVVLSAERFQRAVAKLEDLVHASAPVTGVIPVARVAEPARVVLPARRSRDRTSEAVYVLSDDEMPAHLPLPLATESNVSTDEQTRREVVGEIVGRLREKERSIVGETNVEWAWKFVESEFGGEGGG